MKNFPVKVLEDTIVDGENMKGKTFWVSRSCAVAVFIFAKCNDEWYVLANQRGKGCPDYVGYWSCPCGYVDYDETVIKAAKRELFEESGLRICNIREHYLISDFKNVNYNDDPDEGRQNITFRFVGTLHTHAESLPKLTSENSEPNEIEDQKWILLRDVGKYEWAFNHDKLIFEMFKTL